MATTLTLRDRLRIERALWTLTTYIQSLPDRSQRAIRRDLRQNLRASAAEVGSREAVRQLGDVRRLALGYLDAEYGEGRPRASLLKGMFWGVIFSVMVMTAVIVGFDSFLNALDAAKAPAGTYEWHDAEFLGLTGSVSYDDGGFAGFELGVSWIYLLWITAAVVLGSRLWRVFPLWRRRLRQDREARAERKAMAAR